MNMDTDKVTKKNGNLPIFSVSGSKLKVIETVFLPNWNTTAIICEGGKIYIQLTQGRYYIKEQVRTDLGTGWNDKFYNDREQLFDEIYNYYSEHYCH